VVGPQPNQSLGSAGNGTLDIGWYAAKHHLDLRLLIVSKRSMSMLIWSEIT
jgi:hypothetical protein